MNYFVFCFVAILGTIQGVATRYDRHDLLWLKGRAGYGLGAAIIVGSFVWFLVTDEELFIPGLAGGELFTLFATAFISAIPITRVIAFALAHVRTFAITQQAAREKEPTA